MLVCGCGRWMHTEGIDERVGLGGNPVWFVRFECRGCGLHIGIDTSVADGGRLVDRMLWTDDAQHDLDRVPPYAAPLVREQVESFARLHAYHVITYDVFVKAKMGEAIVWEAEAEQRLNNVPAPVRAMARVELERTAADRGEGRVTVALMEEVKARYFGMASEKS